MKTKIESSKNDISVTRQFMTSAGSSFDKIINSNSYQKQKEKKTSKIIKGKVKIFNKNNGMRLINRGFLNDREELEIVSKRMAIFLKFTFLFLMVFSLLIFFEINL